MAKQAQETRPDVWKRDTGGVTLNLLLLVLGLGIAGYFVVTRHVFVHARPSSATTAVAAADNDDDGLAAAAAVKPTTQSPFEQVRQRSVAASTELAAALPAKLGTASPFEQVALGTAVLFGIALLMRKFAAGWNPDLPQPVPAAAGLEPQSPIPFPSANGITAPETKVEREAVSEFEAAFNVGGVRDKGRGRQKADVAKEAPRNEIAEALAKHAPEHISQMQDRLLELGTELTGGSREDVFAELYVGVHSLAEEAERAGLSEVRHLANTTEKLLKKVLEHPALATESVNETVLSALGLLADVCRLPDSRGPLEGKLRVLAVDDDIMSQRTLATALQLCIGAPQAAGSGEAAIAKAGKDTFDLIFMDVLMPGLDGFETCSKIREGLNRETPVVFVTSQGDSASRSKARQSGGNGFIAKPILPAEIALVALTVTWRHRLAANRTSAAA